MKLVISKRNIEEAVKNICRVINNKNALPILGDILCKVNEQEKSLILIGSDSEIWLTYTLILEEAEGEGQFCVPATRLMDALSQLDEQPVTLIATTESDNMFWLKHSTGETFFPVDNADEYPVPMDFTESSLISMPALELATGITSSVWATANDDLRPIMNGVCLNFMDDKADIVASDGHVMMRYRIDESFGQTGEFVMPKKVAKMLPQMLQWNDGDDADVLWNATQGCVEQDNWSLSFRLIEGKYPNYNAVIPTDSPYECHAERNILKNAVGKVSPFTNDSSNMIRCRFDAKELNIKADDYDFSTGATDKMGVECNVTNPIEIGFKASSLVAILSKIPYWEVTIRLTDPSRAITIEEKPKEGAASKVLGNILALCMPMMLNE